MTYWTNLANQISEIVFTLNGTEDIKWSLDSKCYAIQNNKNLSQTLEKPLKILSCYRNLIINLDLIVVKSSRLLQVVDLEILKCIEQETHNVIHEIRSFFKENQNGLVQIVLFLKAHAELIIWLENFYECLNQSNYVDPNKLNALITQVFDAENTVDRKLENFFAKIISIIHNKQKVIKQISLNSTNISDKNDIFFLHDKTLTQKYAQIVKLSKSIIGIDLKNREFITQFIELVNSILPKSLRKDQFRSEVDFQVCQILENVKKAFRSQKCSLELLKISKHRKSYADYANALKKLEIDYQVASKNFEMKQKQYFNQLQAQIMANKHNKLRLADKLANNCLKTDESIKKTEKIVENEMLKKFMRDYNSLMDRKKSLLKLIKNKNHAGLDCGNFNTNCDKIEIGIPEELFESEKDTNNDVFSTAESLTSLSDVSEERCSPKKEHTVYADEFYEVEKSLRNSLASLNLSDKENETLPNKDYNMQESKKEQEFCNELNLENDITNVYKKSVAKSITARKNNSTNEFSSDFDVKAEDFKLHTKFVLELTYSFYDQLLGIVLVNNDVIIKFIESLKNVMLLLDFKFCEDFLDAIQLSKNEISLLKNIIPMKYAEFLAIFIEDSKSKLKIPFKLIFDSKNLTTGLLLDKNLSSKISEINQFVYYVNFAQRLSHKIKIIYENSRLSKTELLKLKINMNSIYAICAYLKQNIQSKFEEFEKQLLEQNNETPKYLKIKQDFEDLISTLERKCYMTDKYTFLSQIFGAIFENLFKMSKYDLSNNSLIETNCNLSFHIDSLQNMTKEYHHIHHDDQIAQLYLLF